MLTRSIAQSLYHTKFLLERDYLSACFARMGSGFTPPSTLAEAKERIEKIKQLVEHMEAIKDFPKNTLVTFSNECCYKK